ncbi:MAG: alanine dehydrogenase [Candidatus Omnitrophica bacterium]|nr:alanine dehydrogenase [Candidatus Omnitrophota bacterium]
MAFTVGIPKEIKIGERRVSLTPKGVEVLVRNQVKVCVEKAAGLGCGFSDDDYQRAGAQLLKTNGEVWKQATLIKKVKEPVSQEFEFFKSHHIIFTYLHLAAPSERPLVETLKKAKATAIAYETIEKNGQTPLLKPMSEVAGILAAYFAGVFQNHIQVQGKKIFGLETAKPMMEKLAADYPLIPKNLRLGKVAILGGGYVGEQAAQMAASMGGSVSVSEISEFRRKKLREEFSARGLTIQILDPSETNLYEEVLDSCEVLIACVHAPGKRAPLVVDRESLRKISAQKKKIILDVAIDQGGNVAESQPTDYENPLYSDSFGNIRFSVTNMPSLSSRGASKAIEKVSLDYTLALAQGLDSAIERYPELRSGVNVRNGVLVHPEVCEAHKLN